MNVRELVLSNSMPHRVQRHVLFWLGWLALYFASSNVGIAQMPDFANMMLLDFVITIRANWLLVPFCYATIYYLVPKYIITQRYVIVSLAAISLIIAYYFISYSMVRITNTFTRPMLHLGPMPEAIVRYIPFRELIQPMGPLGCCALIGSIRFSKFWYIKQQENVSLVRENAVAELQLLKAQVHPHFLFNTLNNIYSFTLTKSPLAADLIQKLSAILRYMIMEGQKNAVPLREEIDLILDYVSLEKVRYGHRLAITVSVHGATDNLVIAPLLMIPFIENCFKHGSSQLLHDPMINIAITLTGQELLLDVVNNKPAAQVEPERAGNKRGIGLKNVKKRLEILYPGKHTLVIDAGETIFSVRMRVTLSTPVEGEPTIADT